MNVYLGFGGEGMVPLDEIDIVEAEFFAGDCVSSGSGARDLLVGAGALKVYFPFASAGGFSSESYRILAMIFSAFCIRDSLSC